MTNMAALDSVITAPSSTPSRDDRVFSDVPTRVSSPPSSPPGFPWEQHRNQDDRNTATATASIAAPQKTNKNAFSLLGKRKALVPVSDNARPRKQQKAVCESAPKAVSLTQMQMSLGQEVQKKCRQCGMEYTASSAEDRKLHDKFHKQNHEGYDVGKDFLSKTDPCMRVQRLKNGDTIVLVNCFDKHHRQKRAQAALEIVQSELGAVPIPENEMWGKDALRSCTSSSMEAKFNVYMYVQGTKCVALLLAENINEAFEVVKPNSASDFIPRPEATASDGKNALAALKARKQFAARELAEAERHPIELSTSSSSAVLGVSRIWTSSIARGQGIAIALLDAAVASHNKRYARNAESEKNIPKEAVIEKATKPAQLCHKRTLAGQCGHMKKIKSKMDVAFSQPTDSGAKLARKWFGTAYGWKVYVD